jgi:hypothetical protein
MSVNTNTAQAHAAVTNVIKNTAAKMVISIIVGSFKNVTPGNPPITILLLNFYF